MDTSKTYIKMCDCEEIQEQHVGTWQHGDYLCDNKQVFVYPIGYVHGGIWLPRQDQLQEMVWEKLGQYCSNKVSSLAWGVWNYYTEADDNYYPDSMEQLWLAFVMKEKYNKTWNGNSWT